MCFILELELEGANHKEQKKWEINFFPIFTCFHV